jgi:hypothetical protein
MLDQLLCKITIAYTDTFNNGVFFVFFPQYHEQNSSSRLATHIPTKYSSITTSKFLAGPQLYTRQSPSRMYPGLQRIEATSEEIQRAKVELKPRNVRNSRDAYAEECAETDGE